MESGSDDVIAQAEDEVIEDKKATRSSVGWVGGGEQMSIISLSGLKSKGTMKEIGEARTN